MDYNELYEYLRKEKYGELLQALPRNFVAEFSDYLRVKKAQISDASDLFSEESARTKKQFENSLSLFRELMRIRKRKLLNLAFVASETGIMKRDFGTLLTFEQELFEKLVASVDSAEKQLQNLLSGSNNVVASNKMVIVVQPILEFVDLSGIPVGPFDKGALINIDSKVADILLSEGKVMIVDDQS